MLINRLYKHFFTRNVGNEGLILLETNLIAILIAIFLFYHYVY